MTHKQGDRQKLLDLQINDSSEVLDIKLSSCSPWYASWLLSLIPFSLYIVPEVILEFIDFGLLVSKKLQPLLEPTNEIEPKTKEEINKETDISAFPTKKNSFFFDVYAPKIFVPECM